MTSFGIAIWLLCGLVFFVRYELPVIRHDPKTALFWLPVSLMAGPFIWLMRIFI